MWRSVHGAQESRWHLIGFTADMQSVMESNFVFWSNLEAAAQGTNKVSFDTIKDKSRQLMMHFDTLCTSYCLPTTDSNP
jgi:hypothetical protein